MLTSLGPPLEQLVHAQSAGLAAGAHVQLWLRGDFDTGAAEVATPKAKALFVAAISEMTLDDVRAMLVAELRETRGMIDHFLGAYSQHMEEGKGDYH